MAGNRTTGLGACRVVWAGALSLGLVATACVFGGWSPRLSFVEALLASSGANAMSRRLAFAYPIATTSLSIGVENVSRHTDDSHIAVGARFASNTAANSTANALANATAHAAANATAPKNQTTKSGPSDDENTWDNHSSMFCFCVVNTDQELELVRFQFTKMFGIFACNHWAVYSGEGPVAKWIGKYPNGDSAMSKPIPGPPAMRGYQTCNGCATAVPLIENANVLMRAWDRASKDGEAGKHTWIVKVDPDTMLSPSRLLVMLKRSGRWDVPDMWPGRFYRNCGILDSMQGSMEVMSRQAFYNFVNNKWKCYQQMDWYHMGEDIFTFHCMKILGIWSIHLDQALHDMYCSYSGYPNCWVPDIAAFHPLKTVQQQGDCWWKMQQVDHKADDK